MTWPSTGGAEQIGPQRLTPGAQSDHKGQIELARDAYKLNKKREGTMDPKIEALIIEKAINEMTQEEIATIDAALDEEIAAMAKEAATRHGAYPLKFEAGGFAEQTRRAA